MKNKLHPAQHSLSLLIISLLILSLYACNKDEIINKKHDAVLKFSQDTVLFDTVFTSIGSVTKSFKVYNKYDESVIISKIKLAKGNNSPYRINIDGEAKLEVNDLKIRAGDSAFVHVMVTINPGNGNNPFLVQDSVLFEINGNHQDVDLVAYGQDAHFHVNEILQGNWTWTNDKPHVIYGFVIVDDTLNSSLSIDEGTQIYMHDKASLYVGKDASLQINGTVANPVEIQGDRRDAFYDDISGQWGFIYLTGGSVNNYINGTIMKNGTAGILVDTLGNSSEPTLTISNTQIYNMAYYGIRAQGSYVRAANSVIANCGEFEVLLQFGGDYEFYQCTIGDYSGSGGETGALALNNYYISNYDTIARDLTNASFYNSIIFGFNPNEEIVFSQTPMAEFEYYFENCNIRTKQNFEENDRFVNCLNDDPLFHNPELYDFRIDTITSPLVNKGNRFLNDAYTYYDLSNDLLNFNRYSDDAPDIGAYEFQEIPEEE